MYAKISYNADAGNDATQVLTDLNALLTGETIVGNLTGNIDAGTSVIDTSYTTVAWTLYDTVTPSNLVYQIPYHDDPAQFYYMEIITSGTAETHYKLWEFWDSVGNTGTNGSYYTGTGFELFRCDNFTSAPFTIYISATARHLIIRSVYNSGLVQYMRGMMQYDRGEAWDTPAAGFAPVVGSYNDQFTFGPSYPLPHKRSDGAIYTLAPAGLYMHTRYGNSQLDDFNLLIGGSSSAARGLNAAGDPVHNMYEFGYSYLSSGERFLTGKVPDMYLATYQNGGFGDVVSIAAVDYYIWEADLNYRIAIRKG